MISSARAMKKRPPSIVRSASSWRASKGSIAPIRPATTSAPSAPSSTKKPCSSYWRACSGVTDRNGPGWSAQLKPVFRSWSAGPAMLMTR